MIFVSVDNESVSTIVYDHLAEFLTTYVISILSAVLGLTKCLKNGVARPIAPGGTLEGLLTWKFLIGFLASATGLLAKGFCVAFNRVSHGLQI